MNFSMEDQRRYAERQRRLSEQAIGRGLADCASELLDVALRDPHSTIGQSLKDPDIGHAKRVTPNYAAEEARIQAAIDNAGDDSTGAKDYIGGGCALLPSGPESDL